MKILAGLLVEGESERSKRLHSLLFIGVSVLDREIRKQIGGKVSLLADKILYDGKKKALRFLFESKDAKAPLSTSYGVEASLDLTMNSKGELVITARISDVGSSAVLYNTILGRVDYAGEDSDTLRMDILQGDFSSKSLWVRNTNSGTHAFNSVIYAFIGRVARPILGKINKSNGAQSKDKPHVYEETDFSDALSKYYDKASTLISNTLNKTLGAVGGVRIASMDYEGDSIYLTLGSRKKALGDIRPIIQIRAEKDGLHVIAWVQDEDSGDDLLNKLVGVVPREDSMYASQGLNLVLGMDFRWAKPYQVQDFRSVINKFCAYIARKYPQYDIVL